MSKRMNERLKVFRKLRGDNGYGPHVFSFEEVDEVALQMETALDSIVTRGMTEEDAHLIAGISQHIHHGTFTGIARRRGRAWRIVAALADRLIQFEGLAKIYLSGAACAVNLDAAVGVKLVYHSRRLDTLAAVTAQDTSETQAMLEQGIQESREFALRVWRDTRECYWTNFSNRMIKRGDP